jgi:hypothetical protein
MHDRWTQRIADRLRWAGGPAAAAPGQAAAPAVDTAEAVSAVLECADDVEFVRRAYRLVLARDPSPGELAGRVKRLRIPFFTRQRMLRRLLGSVEAQLVVRAEQVRLAAAVAQVRGLCERMAARLGEAT